MERDNYNWATELPCGVTVCDKEGIILFINDKAATTFARFGDNLTGHSLFEFHGERAASMIKKMIAEDSSNSYTIEKEGLKKLIHQMPWYIKGEVAGLVELSIVIPMEMPHFIR